MLFQNGFLINAMFINALIQLAHFMRQGKLVPDEAIFSILSKRLEQKIEHKESGFIIDGFPRTLTQAVRRNYHAICVSSFAVHHYFYHD